MIHGIYRKWQTSPVIVSFAEKTTPVWQIPFPAVTICPETKVLGRELNLSESLKYLKDNEGITMTGEHTEKLDALSHICDRYVYSDIDLNSGLKGNRVIPILWKIAPSIQKIVVSYSYRKHKGE